MNRHLWRILAAALVLSSTLSLGCPSSVYRGETVLHDDGSLDRAVYQPLADTPEPARAANLWKQVTYAVTPDTLKKENFMGGITDLPIRESSKDTPYFAAWNRFKSAKDVPDYYVKKAPEKSGLADAKLIRSHTRTDYGLVVEHRWAETLTDVVTREGMRQAREELADLIIGLFTDTFAEAYGQDWDAAALVKWAKDEGKSWWAEMTDYVYVFCLNNKGPKANEALGDGLRTICARHGLVLPEKKEGMNESPDPQGALADFVLMVLTTHVKNKKTGKNPDPRTVILWLEDFGKEADPKDPTQKPGLWQTAMRKVVAAKYGSKEELDQRLAVLVAQTFGLHYPESFFHSRTFEYTMTVPGEVADTNGEVLAVNKVKWTFPTRLAYPQGYTMEVRSLVVDEELHKQLFKDDTLKDAKSRQGFIYIMKWGPEGMRQAVAECRKQKSLAPLAEYKKKAGPEEQEWVERLENAFKPAEKVKPMEPK
jgi:hypothetical protein